MIPAADDVESSNVSPGLTVPGANSGVTSADWSEDVRSAGLVVMYATVYPASPSDRTIVAAAILSGRLKCMLRSRNCPPLICSKSESETAFLP